MNDEQFQFLRLLHLPGRFTVQQTGWYLGFPEDGIPYLTRIKLLVPAGDPGPKAIKLYLYSDLVRLRINRRWMNTASSRLYRHRENKNVKAYTKRKRKS
jgi:hypothetical protein